MKTTLFSIVAALAATICVACGADPTPTPPVPDITPRPQPEQTPSTTSTIATTGTLSTAAEDQPPATLSELRPCELLNAEQVAVYGYTNTQAFEDESPRTCTYSTNGNSRQLIITFAAAGIADLHPDPTDTVTHHNIGIHDTVQARSARHAMCTIYLDISENTMVTVQMLGEPTSDAACHHATDVATAIEPSLP